jgi:uncharacterized protein DUF5947
MSTIEDTGSRTALASLRRFSRGRDEAEFCHLCRSPLRLEHPHLLELNNRQLRCACEACAVLFSQQGAAKYRRVSRRADYLLDFQLSDWEWEQLHLPINLAFFTYSTAHGRIVAQYPSPAGATEALPAEDAWAAIVAKNPVLAEFEPDVEALLVNRLGSNFECFRIGIDECYRLVGLIRTHWRGLSGGTDVWRQIARFFSELKGKCHAVSAAKPA